MRVVYKKDTSSSATSNTKRFVPPPIPLSRPEVVEPKKNECLSIKLRSDPADNNSQTYELTVKFFRTGTPEEWLVFMRDLKRVLTGQNITTGPPKYAMARRLIFGDTLAVFNKAALDKGNETVANFELVLKDVTTHVFPQRALAYQKRYMRRYMRKPRDMSTRLFVARIAEMNAYLQEFPPFEDNQELDEQEIVDILEFGVPNSWQKNMVLQGFDPMIHAVTDFVEFCERHEFTEGSLDNSDDKAKPKASSKNSSNDGKSRAKSSAEAPNKKRHHGDEKWCDLHQTNGHSTAECKVVQSQITKMRNSWEPVRPNPNHLKGNNNNNDKNKSFMPKDKKELMSLMGESFKQMLKAKKQKTNHVHNVESNKNDDSSDFDLEDFKLLEVDDSDNED
jgi:hypothetical protein